MLAPALAGAAEDVKIALVAPLSGRWAAGTTRDPSRRIAMGRAGRQRVEQMFTARQMARRVGAVWERLGRREGAS